MHKTLANRFSESEYVECRNFQFKIKGHNNSSLTNFVESKIWRPFSQSSSHDNSASPNDILVSPLCPQAFLGSTIIAVVISLIFSLHLAAVALGRFDEYRIKLKSPVLSFTRAIPWKWETSGRFDIQPIHPEASRHSAEKLKVKWLLQLWYGPFLHTTILVAR